MVAIYLYCFHDGLALYAFILPLATARGKIFVIKQYELMATGNYFLIRNVDKETNPSTL
jgi:hypothetical protein